MGTRTNITPAFAYKRWRELKWCTMRELAASLKITMYAARKLTSEHFNKMRQPRTCDVCGSTNMVDTPSIGWNCNDCHPIGI